MAATLVDSNVLLDIITEGDEGLDWSAAALSSGANDATLVINPIVYADAAIDDIAHDRDVHGR